MTKGLKKMIILNQKQIIKKKKDKENNEYFDHIKKSNYQKNIFHTLDKNNERNSPNKKNLELQEKLKKIFLIDRDKLKFQYTKQYIPDNLKYHSDDSDGSEISGSRKSKISKKKDELFKDNNEKNK